MVFKHLLNLHFLQSLLGRSLCAIAFLLTAQNLDCKDALHSLGDGYANTFGERKTRSA
ncbi:MAG: hypothetical protein V7K77_13375 [Nostoc sp.]|uniref:hypothetical protein n=1 Tax=Nostoc sp. TaxID=1180 RepID=UPI002FF71999